MRVEIVGEFVNAKMPRVIRRLRGSGAPTCSEPSDLQGKGSPLRSPLDRSVDESMFAWHSMWQALRATRRHSSIHQNRYCISTTMHERVHAGTSSSLSPP